MEIGIRVTFRSWNLRTCNELKRRCRCRYLYLSCCGSTITYKRIDFKQRSGQYRCPDNHLIASYRHMGLWLNASSAPTIQAASVALAPASFRAMTGLPPAKGAAL